MTEQEWLTSENPAKMWDTINDKALPFVHYLDMSARKLRLIAAACVKSSNLSDSERFGQDKNKLSSYHNSFGYGEDGKELHPGDLPRLLASWFKERYEYDPSDIIKCNILRDTIGNPFHYPRPVNNPLSQVGRVACCANEFVFHMELLNSTITSIAQNIYDNQDFDSMPILGDALEEAGCDNKEILSHCREPGTHYRGCWVLDLVLNLK